VNLLDCISLIFQTGVVLRLNMTLKEILADPSISSWLKDAIKTAYEQDPVDALRDAHRLLKMLGERYTQIVNRDVVQ
ncbi:MAG TPA: hypothetical protein VGF37_04675, partial [Chthoniobacterales bacterium]